MARYIDADALIEKIDQEQTALETNNSVLWEINRKYWKGLVMARAIIDEQPTASVAPRAEVAREICCEIEKEIVAALESNYEARRARLAKPCVDMADEFIAHCEGKINALRGLEYFVEELKNKYTSAPDTNVGHK